MIICEICTDIPKTAKDYCVNKLVVVVARTFFAENIFFVSRANLSSRSNVWHKCWKWSGVLWQILSGRVYDGQEGGLPCVFKPAWFRWLLASDDAKPSQRIWQGLQKPVLWSGDGIAKWMYECCCVKPCEAIYACIGACIMKSWCEGTCLPSIHWRCLILGVARAKSLGFSPKGRRGKQRQSWPPCSTTSRSCQAVARLVLRSHPSNLLENLFDNFQAWMVWAFGPLRSQDENWYLTSYLSWTRNVIPHSSCAANVFQELKVKMKTEKWNGIEKKAACQLTVVVNLLIFRIFTWPISNWFYQSYLW